MTKTILRQIPLWLLAISFPLLYLGAVTLESTLVTSIALATTVASNIITVVFY